MFRSGALKTAFLSAVICICLLLQAIIGLTFHSGTRWPFVSYPMYGQSRLDGERIRDYTTYAVLDDGKKIQFNAEEYGFSFWIFRKNYIIPFVHGLFDDGEMASLVRVLCTVNPTIARLQVYDIGVSVGRNGPTYGEPELKGLTDIECAGSSAHADLE